MGTGGAANDPGTLGLPESVTSAVAKMPSLMQLPLRAATALLAPGSGEGLLSLLPRSVRDLLPGWDLDRDMPDMFGKVVLITGANSGIGFHTARLLARNNAQVIMVVRDEDKGRKAADQIRSEFGYAKLTLLQADMSSLKSVKALADSVLSSSTPLHVLINNAGVLAPGPFTVTADGFELTHATNYYGPLYLTLLLLPRLRASAPSRVVNVASFAEVFGKVHWDDLRGVDLGSSGLVAYAASKLYLIMASLDLNRRLRGTGVDVFPVHPGIVSSPGEAKSDKRYFVSVTAFLSARLHGQSELRGALAPLYAASEPRLQGRGGTYMGPNAFGLQLFGWGGFNTVPRSPVNWAAHSAETCKRLYDETRAVLDSATAASGLGQVPVTAFGEAQKDALAGYKLGAPLAVEGGATAAAAR